MPKRCSIDARSIIRHWLWYGSLVCILCLGLPEVAFASVSVPTPEGPEECANCHQTETETWVDSPHAQIMTCEQCHGEYVPEHPQQGVMTLAVDSSMCQSCHSATAQEWQTTAHADAGVQCISCHQSHTQETRLTGMNLCASCHGERVETFEHTAHSAAGIACTSCHLSSGTVTELGGDLAPNHTFGIDGEACVDCHGGAIHQQVMNAEVARIDAAELSLTSQRVQDLARQLDDAKRDNRSLQAMSVVSLGFGLGIGGVLGIIMVAVICRFMKEGSGA